MIGRTHYDSVEASWAAPTLLHNCTLLVKFPVKKEAMFAECARHSPPSVHLLTTFFIARSSAGSCQNHPSLPAHWERTSRSFFALFTVRQECPSSRARCFNSACHLGPFLSCSCNHTAASSRAVGARFTCSSFAKNCRAFNSTSSCDQIDVYTQACRNL